ncbi:hypothetical protein L6452_06507 [Arctium lappa]|uniref:Uncharacterized protein n=1 Tax=Arctium lappa TaxID=4217 RepID=A0ACB9EIW2_ARCLA|nr:hypothetical protein L6452_06507 [Arctium lappa]
MEDGDDKGELEDSPAIKALGSLFKLTQVNFWVDLASGMPYGSTSVDCTKTVKDDAICFSQKDNCSLPVDTELSRQMDELGLPLSFCTNKEVRYNYLAVFFFCFLFDTSFNLCVYRMIFCFLCCNLVWWLFDYLRDLAITFL